MKWKDLPIEIQNKMLDEQEKQWNPRSPKPFVEKLTVGQTEGGFNWSETIDDYDMWWEILRGGNIEEFYKKYPKATLPEKWFIKVTRDNYNILGEWANNNKVSPDSGDYVTSNAVDFNLHSENVCQSNHLKKLLSGGGTKKGFEEITIEQFKEHILKDTTTTDNRFPFQLTEQDAKEIIKVACAGWKEKLVDRWKNILMNEVYMLSEEEYKEMRKACTEEQHKLFDKIFGIDEKWCPDNLYWVRLTGKHEWSLKYAAADVGNFYVNQQTAGYTSQFPIYQLATGVKLPS